MIPRLDQHEDLHERVRALLEALPAAGFGGELRADLATRLVTATDNSVYQLLPQLVVYPKATGDVVALCRLLAEERFRDVTISPRGGGTGTNGQSLSEGVIVDVSRHMNAILELDLEAGWVRVQPGVVLDQLNDHLRPHGVFFAPNLSPSSRATLGGMINTDACGKGSRVYGKTSQHVLDLTVVLMDGTEWTTSALDADALAQVKAREDRVGEVHRVVDAIATTKAALIAEQFPKLSRFLTGYNLAKVRSGESFDLGWILSGSEGTLGIVTEARLRVTPLPKHKRLVVVKYATFDDALASAREVVEADPGAIETIDETVLGLAREDAIWHAVGGLLTDAPEGPRTAAVNLVEFEGDDAAAVAAKAEALVADIEARAGEPGRPVGYVVAADARESAALWSLRAKGVGLLGNAPGPRKPVAFVEDTAVPPEHLADYVREFRALLDAEGLRYGMFGHIDVGCLHVRPALDLKDPEDEVRLRRISDAVVALVKRYGGVMWAEHGKGFRSEYSPRFFGDELYGDLCRIKAAFDPHNQLNPGKLAVPAGSGASLVSVDGPKRGALDRQIPPPVRERFALALDCNGNGACFDYHPDHVMCPSSKVTRDRIHSPKGRAGLMREWLRQLARAGFDPLAARQADASWWAAPARWWRRWRASRDPAFDYSRQVYAAMDGCLACKACATQCPIKVDVPSLRAEFLTLYHTRYPRPLSDRLVAGLERVLPLMAALPRLTNAVVGSAPVRWLLARVAGMVDTPRLAVRSLGRELRERGAPRFDVAALERLSEAERARTVILLQDAFTTFYEPAVTLAVYDLLVALGFSVHVPPYFPNGKGLHVKGYVRRFEALAGENAVKLRRWAATGVPLVGVDPAVVLTYRDEYRHALGGAPGFEVALVQELLDAHLERLGSASAGLAADREPYTLLGHCTERTAALDTPARWRRIFEACGLALEPREVGCCGMCGAYGHEARHREESRGVYAMSWGPVVASADADGRARLLATGHSCRSQVERFGEATLRHPAEVLAARLRQAAGGPGSSLGIPPRLV